MLQEVEIERSGDEERYSTLQKAGLRPSQSGVLAAHGGVESQGEAKEDQNGADVGGRAAAAH